MSEEMMNTKELAHYLGIHEKQVYALVKAKKIPSTRITGKWVFPRKLVEEWIEMNAQKGIEQARLKGKRIQGALLAAGSNDPILDILQTQIRRLYPELYIFSANTGSTEGLKALDKGYTDLAWSHILDPSTGEYNITFIPAYLPSIKPVLVNLFHRDLGFVAAPGNPRGIKGFEDLARKGTRFVNRQDGAGTRLLLDHHLKRLNISSESITGYENEVYTHFEVGLAVLSKQADVGIATSAAAKMMGLSFVQITQESFDMVMVQETFFEKGVQAFLEVLRSSDFQSKVGGIGNYDFKNSGKIRYSFHQ